VASDRHGDLFGHARADEIADRRAPVMPAPA